MGFQAGPVEVRLVAELTDILLGFKVGLVYMFLKSTRFLEEFLAMFESAVDSVLLLVVSLKVLCQVLLHLCAVRAEFALE